MINLNVLYKYNDSNQQRGMLIGFTENNSDTWGLIVSEEGRIHLVELDNIKVVR